MMFKAFAGPSVESANEDFKIFRCTRQCFGIPPAEGKSGVSLLQSCGCSHRGWRSGDGLFDRIAERMPHQDVAFLNARGFA